MAVSHWMKSGVGTRLTVRILTVDPASRRVEGALKDGGLIQIRVFEVGPIFRWPATGELWTVRQDDGIWSLVGRIESEQDGLGIIEELPEGDTKIVGDTKVVGNLTVGSNKVVHTPSTPTNGQSLVWNGSDWIATQRESLNVKDYGAKGDGVADDTAAINAALAALPANEGTVYLPPGTYKTTATITLTSRQWLVGAGYGIRGASGSERGSSTIASSFNGNVVTIGAGTFECGIRDLTVSGDRAQAAQVLVNINPTSSGEVGPISLDHVDLINAGQDCIQMYGALNCSFSNVRTNLAIRYGLYARDGFCNRNAFYHCSFRTSNQYGVRWGGTSVANLFSNCLIEANNQLGGYGGFWLEAGMVTLDTCYFEANTNLAGRPLLIATSTRIGGVVEIACEYAEFQPIEHSNGLYVAIAPRWGMDTDLHVVSSATWPPEIIRATTNSIIRTPTLRRAGVDIQNPHGTFMSRVAPSGDPLEAADIALAGWGDTASIDVVEADDSSMRIRLASTGTGQTANPTITITFEEGNWVRGTKPIAGMGTNTTDKADIKHVIASPGTTNIQLMYIGTPTAGRYYEFFVHLRS